MPVVGEPMSHGSGIYYTEEVRKLEYDCPPIPKPRGQGKLAEIILMRSIFQLLGVYCKTLNM